MSVNSFTAECVRAWKGGNDNRISELDVQEVHELYKYSV